MPGVTGSAVEQDIVRLVPQLKAFARRFYYDPSDIDDLVQETLVKALTSIHLFQTGTNLRSWLFTIMRNTHHTQFSTGKRWVIGLENVKELMPTVPPSQEWALRAKDFEKAMAGLPQHQRQAIKHVFVDGMSYEAVATMHKCPVGTIKSRVNRARDGLATKLGDKVSTAAQL